MYQKILVPVDGSATSEKALATALGLAKAFGSQLRLVHVVEEMAYLAGYDQFGGYSGELIRVMRETGRKILDEAGARVAAEGVAVDSVLFDEFGERLAETVAREAAAWQADLIVVGTHGRRGMRRALLGSGAEQIIRLAPVPALVVRAPEDEPAAGGQPA